MTRSFTQRYSLDVQINSSHNAELWRAIDKSLDRVVCIVLLPHSDSRYPKLLEQAKSAAVNSSRNAVAILDIVENAVVSGVRAMDPTVAYLGIVTEWVDGQTIDHLLTGNQEPFAAKEALGILAQVATAVSAMHKLGLIHGHLRPRNVYVNDAKEIRVTGFGIDSSLFTPDGSSVATDISGIGDLLFALTTGTWPHGAVGGLPGAEILSGQMLTFPSQMRVGVSADIDKLYGKTQDGSFTSVDELLREISIVNAGILTEARKAFDRWTEHEVVWHGKDIPKSHRLRATVLAFTAIYLIGLAGWQLMTHNYNTAAASLPTIPAITSSPVSSTGVSPTASPAQSSALWPTTYATAVSAAGYDPFGDGSENPKLGPLAIDGDPKTAWTTTPYYSSNLGNKSGVGLLVDLGASTKVTRVEVTFTNAGHSGTVFICDSPNPDLPTAQALGTVSNSDLEHTFIPDKPQTGRYILIWLTKLPQINFGPHIGGIAEVKIGL